MKLTYKKFPKFYYLIFSFVNAIILLITMTSCGYRFSGQGSLPKDIKSIHIAIFENRTREIAAEHIFTNDLISEFTKNRIKITNREKADALLTGVIETMRINTISRKDSITSLERRIIAGVSISLTDPNGNTIWSDSNIFENETYNIMTEKSDTTYGKKSAIHSISKRIAEEIYDRLTQKF